LKVHDRKCFLDNFILHWAKCRLDELAITNNVPVVFGPEIATSEASAISGPQKSGSDCYINVLGVH
jgi:hypothetical protein